MVYMSEGSWGGRVRPPHLSCHSSFNDVAYAIVGVDVVWCFTCAWIVLMSE